MKSNLLTIEVTHTQAPLTIDSSRTRLRQILENLVTNAIKYHDPNKPLRSLDVHYECVERQLRLAVRDNGTGLDDDIAGSAFDLFVRGTSKHPGSGIGLYLVRKHAEALGGSVQLTSPRDATEFVLEVPIDLVH